MPTSASGDTFTYTLTGITTAVEWKPLLDDTTWAIGPNYHVAPGQILRQNGSTARASALFKLSAARSARRIWGSIAERSCG